MAKDQLQSDYCAEMLRAIGDPDRLKIIDRLRTASRNVGQLAEELDMPMVNVSHHLSVLRNAKVVLGEKEGRHVNYSLNPEYFRAAKTQWSPDQLDLGCCSLQMPKG